MVQSQTTTAHLPIVPAIGLVPQRPRLSTDAHQFVAPVIELDQSLVTGTHQPVASAIALAQQQVVTCDGTTCEVLRYTGST